MARGSRGNQSQTITRPLARELSQMRRKDLNNLDASDAMRLQILGSQANRLEEIVTEQGWPRRSDVGQVAALAAWLVAQHSPSLGQQKRFYQSLKEAVASGEAERAHLAQLEDRILVRQGKQQLYGTQWRVDEEGKQTLLPIANKSELAERRSAVGLDS